MRVTRALQRGKTRRRRRLGLQKESPALHREASRERDPVSISYTDRIGVVKSRCLRDAHPSLAVCTVDRSPHSIGGSLFGSTVTERADRHSIRTASKVARLESISGAVVLRVDHSRGGGAVTPGPVGRCRGEGRHSHDKRLEAYDTQPPRAEAQRRPAGVRVAHGGSERRDHETVSR